MGGTGAVEIIPLGDIKNAREGLLGHARTIQEAARWLEEKGYHAASIYFSVLCLEEASRHHVMSACEGDGRGVTGEDLRDLYDHRKKLARCLDGAVPAARPAGGRPASPGAELPACEEMADVLVRAKECAVYFDFGGGSMKTLEALLGAEATKRASGLLLSVVEHGISAILPPGSVAQGSRGERGQDPQAGVRAALAELMATLGELEAGTACGADVRIPRGHLDTVLFCLEDHLGDMAKITHELHAEGHASAAVHMGVMTIEEGSKHYLLARCRWEGRDVLRGDMREMRNHREKLAAFFRHVARALGKSNIDGETGRFVVLDPDMLTSLHDVKKLAIHFVRMAGETMTLDAMLGSSMRNLSDYVNETAQWIISWMIMNDGDVGDPYARHDPNPVHLERYERFGRFIDNPENVAQYHGWSKMTKLLKGLNDAAQGHDAAGCKAALAAIREYGMWD